MDKAMQILLEALRQGAESSAQSEHRLYRSGKIPGLFTGKTSLNNEIAAQALRDGLLEHVRTETRGKSVTEWVTVTAQGREYLVQHESPLKSLEDLHALLKQNAEGLPGWLAELQTRLGECQTQLVNAFGAMSQRIEALGQRVEDALKRAERMGPALPDGAAAVLPWSNEAVQYLEQRRRSGIGEACPLPELFSVVRKKEADVAIRDFHSGLRRLHDRGVLRLLPFEGEGGPPEPEYALLDGPAVYYFAASHLGR